MNNQFDLEKARQQWKKFSKEAVEWAKKSEEDIMKLSSRGKLHVDATTTGLRLEHLCYLIGKEYVSHSGKRTSKMTQLLGQYKKLIQEQKSLKSKLNQNA